MLKVFVPQLQRINPSLFEGFFYKNWPRFFEESLKDPKWTTIQGEFFWTAQSACTNIFANFVGEVINSINSNIPFDLENVTVDLTSIYDGYDCSDVNFEHFSSEEVWEKVYNWLEHYVNTLLSPSMLSGFNKAILPIYHDLLNVKVTTGLVGYWYSTYDMESTLWEKQINAYGIEYGDFEEVYRGYWPHSFYRNREVGEPYLWSFYRCNTTGVIYLEDTGVQIPNGADVTYCQIRKDRGHVIYQDY